MGEHLLRLLKGKIPQDDNLECGKPARRILHVGGITDPGIWKNERLSERCPWWGRQKMPCAVLHVLGCTAAVLADYKDMVFPSCGEKNMVA